MNRVKVSFYINTGHQDTSGVGNINPPHSMSFRLSAKYLLLTYPNCGDKQACYNFLIDKFDDAKYILVAQETHQSGEPHLHAFIALTKRCNFKRADCLDFNGFHGNYQVARDKHASVTYCKKDDANPLEYGHLEASRESKWAIARTASSRDEFMEAVADADYKTFVCFHDKIDAFATKKFKSDPMPYTDPFSNSWIPNTALDGWALENVTNWTPSIALRPKSLILIGDSRLGKTAWARRHGEHVYFNGTWNVAKLDCLSNTTKYAVWDDLFNWDAFNYKQWLGGQWEFEVTGKYRAPRSVHGWGRPSIVCCNELPSQLDNSWVKENCLIVYVRFALFQ